MPGEKKVFMGGEPAANPAVAGHAVANGSGDRDVTIEPTRGPDVETQLEPSTRPKRDGFLVLGMHRSGTSAISGTLARLGATPPKTLLEGQADNPRGHWESVKLIQLHDELLASAGSRWDDWRAFDTHWYTSPMATEFKNRAKGLLAAEFGNAQMFVLKDPRICRFVRFWLEIFAEEGITPRLVLPLRHPLEVAQSLKARGGTSINEGLLLWLRHSLDAEIATRDMPRVIVSWSNFMQNWRREFARIEMAFTHSWVRNIEEASPDIDDFISANLVHESVKNRNIKIESDERSWIAGAFDAIFSQYRGKRINDAQGRLDIIRGEFDGASKIFGDTIEGLIARIGALANDLTFERQALAQANREIQRLSSENG